MLAPLALLLLSSSTAGASSLALCTTVSQAQVELALGHRLEAAAPEYSRLTSTCDYGQGDTAVRIATQHLTTPLDLNIEIATLKAAFPSAEISALKGLGTQALALNLPDAGIQLHILQGDREYLLISVMGAGTPQFAFEAATKLARALLLRSQ